MTKLRHDTGNASVRAFFKPQPNESSREVATCTHPSIQAQWRNASEGCGDTAGGPGISIRYAQLPETSRYWQGWLSLTCKHSKAPRQEVAFDWVEQRAGEPAVPWRWLPCTAQAYRVQAPKRHFTLNTRST